MFMKFEQTSVQAYSGYKHNERPLAFDLHGKRYTVTAILDRWYEGAPEPGKPYLDYFKVLADDGQCYILRYNGMFDAWSVMVPD
jgi:hypothetical protein